MAKDAKKHFLVVLFGASDTGKTTLIQSAREIFKGKMLFQGIETQIIVPLGKDKYLLSILESHNTGLFEQDRDVRLTPKLLF
jgi:uridine kinase